MTADTAPISWFGQFGVTHVLIRKALAEATRHGASDADLFFEHSVSTTVGLSDHAVNRAHTSIDLGVGVRVVVGDQVGYAYTESLAEEDILRAARTASAIARTSNGWTQPEEIVVRAIKDFYPVSRHWSDVDLSERVPLVRDWESRAMAVDPRVSKVQVSLSDTDRHVLIARVDGTLTADYRPMTRGSVSVTAEEGDRRESGSHNCAARADLAYFDPERQERLVQKSVERALRALTATPAPTGEMPVVMAAGESGILLHEAIGHGMEADFNRKGISIYEDKLGKRIAPPSVTICDDATLPNARGSINVDDEGSPTENTVLVEEGILRSYIHDRISARHYGVEPTGSGRRESFRHPVLPRMRSTYMQSGTHTAEEIIANVDRGIYCETFANGAVQIGAGDFSFYVRLGYLIENGKLTRPIKDVNLIGNGPKVLESIEMVGDDLTIDEGGWTCGKEGQGVPVSQGMPTVLVSNLSVGGQQT